MASIFELFDQFRFQTVGIGNQFASGDLFRSRTLEAEFADAIGVGAFVFEADRRAELAAGHGAVSVEVASSGGGVEGRTGFVVGELVEGGLVIVENSRFGIAGERQR